jgi:hypothetical protein
MKMANVAALEYSQSGLREETGNRRNDSQVSTSSGRKTVGISQISKELIQ